MVKKLDLYFEDHGSIWLIYPRSDAGLQWLSENVDLESTPLHWVEGGIPCEPRYVADIALGAAEEGLSVGRSS